jgi:SAM-dependent methyltransferase
MTDPMPQDPATAYQQFEQAPYPDVPIEQSPDADQALLYSHSLVTPIYLRDRQVITPQGRTILDVGCGSGYTTLILALANPGATIVGIDPSPASIKIARGRLAYHKFDNVQFAVLGIEQLDQLQQTFDLINCDEVLYLLEDTAAGLAAMKAVLKPEGVIRANLHSAIQRFEYYRGQRAFKLLGLMSDDVPSGDRVDLVRTVMGSLPDWIDLKQKTWSPSYEEAQGDQIIRMNYLLAGDRGFTVPDLFELLAAADLAWINMVNWQQWDLIKLLGGLDDLPMVLGLSLSSLSAAELLALFELLHPIHRLLDFWCGHDDRPTLEPVTCTATTRVSLHPQLQTPTARQALLEAVGKNQPFSFHDCLPLEGVSPRLIDSLLAACLLPLWDQPQTVAALASRWQLLRPVDPVSLLPVSSTQAQAEIEAVLAALSPDLYVLLEDGQLDQG